MERRAGRDNREIALHVTRRGKSLREQILKERLAAMDSLIAPLTADEEETLAGLLHKLLSSMETTDLERRNLCRLCDNRVCTNCPIPADF